MGREGVPIFFLEREDKHEKGGDVKMGGCHFFNLHFDHIYGVYGKSKVCINTSFNNTVPQSFELAMQDVHQSLYIAKRLYQFLYF